MKITIDAGKLSKALGLVAPAAASRTTKPILANILAIAEGDSLTLCATDLEIGVRHELRGVDIARSGRAVLPQKLAAIAAAASGDIVIDVDSDVINVRTASGKYKLPKGDADEFPEVSGGDGGGFDIDAQKLQYLIDVVSPAADKKESGARWAVTGVLFEIGEDGLRLVATDTKRLHICGNADVKHKDWAGAHPLKKRNSALVPSKALPLVAKLMSGGAVKVAWTDREVTFTGETSTVSSRLVEGRFPPYADILPKSFKNSAELVGGDLLAGFRQASIMADKETSRVECAFSDGKITLASQGDETGSSEVVVNAPGVSFSETIAFDPKYVIDILKNMAGTITVQLNDGNKPAVIRSGDFTGLIMPLSVG